MTMPHERTRAVLQMAEQVMALAPYIHGQSETVRVPRSVLRALHGTLRHYPGAFDLDVAARTAPDVFSDSTPSPPEPASR